MQKKKKVELNQILLLKLCNVKEAPPERKKSGQEPDYNQLIAHPETKTSIMTEACL